MKTCATLLIVMTALAVSPVLWAQDSSEISFEGNYSLSASGSASCIVNGFSGTCTVNQGAAANLQFGKNSRLSWSSKADMVTSASLHDKFVSACPPPGGSFTITWDGTGGATSSSELDIDPAKGTYTFNPRPFENLQSTLSGSCGSGTGTGNVNLFPASNWPQKFALPPTVQPLTISNFAFNAASTLPTPGPAYPWKISLILTPTVHDDDPCKQSGGAGVPVSSSIGCQNQSLGEDVPIVDTGFNLHYESNRAPGAGGSSVASAFAFMIGGWTLSVNHAYDPTTNTLFLGDGSQRNGYQLGRPVFFNGNFLFTSKDGSEVYVFSGSTGRHLQTLRPLTGAFVYQFGYDSAGNLVTVTDANGNVTTIQRDSSEHPTAIVSPYGQTTTLKMDGNGFLSQVTDPLGKSATFVNTSTGLLTSRTDENGNTFNYTYDANGRLSKDADPLGGFVSLTRTNASSGFGWTAGQTTSMGRTSSYQSTLTVPWVQTSTSKFSVQHTNTLPNGLQATESKTQQGMQISESVALPDGTSSSDTLGPDPVWGLQAPITTSETLTEGSLTMNISGSRTATLGTPGNPFTLTNRTDTTTVNGRTYTSVFTESNRTFVDTTPVARKLTTVLDSKERVASIQLGDLLASNLTYDSRGRLSTVTQGTGTTMRTTTLTYDSDGRLATATDPLGFKSNFSYDADGRLLTTTLPDGRVISYSYDANGNLTALTPPGKSPHDFAYTAVDLPSSYTPPAALGSGPTTYSYNTDRDITKITRPDGKTITFDYDSAGRSRSVITPSETVNYAYDSKTGNLTSASITSGEALAYGYNGPLPTSISWTGSVNGSVSLSYDNNFRVTSEKINAGNPIAFSYDKDDLVTNAGALTLNRSAQDGLVTGTTLGLATDSRTYNSFGELTGYTVPASGPAVYQVSYARDADGRVSSKTETIGGATNTFAYAYDAAGRLAGVSKNGTPISSYTYDSNSNRLTATTSSGAVAATYDAQDRLLSYGTAAYTYTANGELASQTLGTQKTTYQYDVFGNLVSVALPSSKTISYVVDAQNRRVGKKVNGALVEGFLYEGGKIVAQLNGSNSLVSQFIYASGTNSPDYMVSGGVTYRIFSDQLGSPRLIVNTSTGAIAEQIVYDEFGNVITDTKPGFQPFGFAGGLGDQDTKLVRFGARDYDPKTGRWTAKDPIGFGGADTNLYGYVLNDPVNMTDVAGLCPPPDPLKKYVEGAKAIVDPLSRYSRLIIVYREGEAWIVTRAGYEDEYIVTGPSKDAGRLLRKKKKTACFICEQPSKPEPPPERPLSRFGWTDLGWGWAIEWSYRLW